MRDEFAEEQMLDEEETGEAPEVEPGEDDLGTEDEEDDDDTAVPGLDPADE